MNQRSIRTGLALSAVFCSGLLAAAQAPPTQTRTGGTVPPPQRPPTTIINESLPQSGEILTLLNSSIIDRGEKENGAWIFGRDSEVAALEDGLVLADNKTVILESEDKQSGKTGLFEELARRHLKHFPQDRFYVLNLDNLDPLNEQDAATKLKAELINVMKNDVVKGDKGGPGHAFVLIPELKRLMRGQVLSPVDALWDVVGAKQIHFVIESSPKATDAALERSRVPDLGQGIIRQSVLPASYDAVRIYALQLKQWLAETRKIIITTDAVETAARLAVRKMGETGNFNLNRLGAFGRVQKLILRTAERYEQMKSTGQTLTEITNAELRLLQSTEKSLLADLEADPGNADLQKRLADTQRQLTSARNASANAGTPSSLQEQLALAERDLIVARNNLDTAESNWRTFGIRLGSKPDEVKDAEVALKEATDRIHRLEDDINLSPEKRPAKGINRDLILNLAASWLKTSVATLDNDFESGLRNLQQVKNEVFGQDHAIDAIERALKRRAAFLQEGKEIKSKAQADRIRAGMEDDLERPLGSFWFAGDTGVGKTELAKQTAEKLGYRFIPFDMSEFMQEHYVARLIGSPQGYVGYGEDAMLIQALERNPESVILFDEIEKAHPKLQNVFLQLFDKGIITSGDGKKTVSARKAIIMVTSNLAQEIAGWERGKLIEFLVKGTDTTPAMSVEEIKTRTDMDLRRLRSEVYKSVVTSPEEMRQRGMEPMRKEIVGRIDEVIVFNRLDQKTVMKIAEKSLRNLKGRLQHFHDVNFRLTEQAVAAIVDRFNPREGGRSVRRAVDNLLRATLSDLILDKSLKSGDALVVDADAKTGLSFTAGRGDQLNAALTETAATGQSQADAMRRRIDARKRPDFAAFMELVRTTFHPELLMPEPAFARFRGGRR